MNGLPDEWFRNNAERGPGNRRPAPEPGRAADPTVRLPYGGRRSHPAVAPPSGGWHGRDARSPRWPDQPPAGAPDWEDVDGSFGGPGRRGGRRRRILKFLAALIALLLVAAVGMYFYLDSKLTRVAVLADYSGRPAGGAGQNWLITGSDSRQGLTRQQEQELATGHDISGQRSDTIMLLHIPGSGGPATLVSLPRDSYVPIPGYGHNKLNAAFSLGGPSLLAQTVQNVTGLRIDHYMGIGFGGLVSVVDSVGGVNVCVKNALHDRASGLDLQPGCQTLNGGQALGYVRDRHSFGASDLQRVQDQRAFLKALLQKATSPGVFLNPFAAIPTARNSAGALTVDQGTHLYQLVKAAFALRGPQTTTVPIATGEVTAVGDVLVWDRAKAIELFDDLAADRPIPKSLLSGTSGA